CGGRQDGLGARAALLIDHAVDDDVSDVQATRAELARHALGERAQPELGHGKRSEAGAAADRAGGTGEDDGAAPSWQHRRGRGLADEKPGKAAGPPGALEQRLRQVENAAAVPGPDIEYHEIRRAEVRRGLRERRRDLLADRGIAGIAANAFAMLV